MNVIYYDMMEVNDEIKSYVNIERFGDLHYKKMSLFEHNKKLFAENQLKNIYRVSNKTELRELLNRIAFLESEKFLFISSNIIIIDKELFSVFIKKIKYIEAELAICGVDCLKPLLKMSHKEIVSLLIQIENSTKSIEEIINQRKDILERFSRELFYHEIKNYTDFVTYLQSSFELRFFNSIQTTSSFITKRSEQKEKMRKEYNYYAVLPDEMKLYFLPPFKFKEYDNYAEYSLEKLQILDVSIQWIHHSISINEFSVLLNRLFEFLHQRKTIVSDKKAMQNNHQELYVEKLLKRTADFKKTSIYGTINNILTDSTDYNSFDEVINKYLKLYSIITRQNSDYSYALSHGDLCFSNILYDKRISLLKLIDPRGCDSEEEGYLDFYYDITKLSHSILGNYDFINSGIFDIKYDEQLRVKLEITGASQLEEHKTLFKTILRQNDYSYKLIRLYESSLFLSMLPLHIDFPKKVLAYILTAISILEELENEKRY